MPIYLEPYQANPALTPRVYPVEPYHEMVAARAQLARASAATAPNCDDVTPCTCCKKKDGIYWTYKGPKASSNGKDCATAEKNYKKVHDDCKEQTVDLELDSGYTDTNPKVYSPGSRFPAITPASGSGIGPHDASGPDEPVELKSRFPKGGPEPITSGGKSTSDSGVDSGSDTGDGGTGTPTPEKGAAPGGMPQDLFAKFPSVSKMFNGVYTKLCTANMKIPFVCQSLAYFEIAVIAVAVLVLVLLLGKKRRR